MPYTASPSPALPPQQADLDPRALIGFLATSESYLLHSRVVMDDRGRPCIEPRHDSIAERREAFVRLGALRIAAAHLMRNDPSAVLHAR